MPYQIIKNVPPIPVVPGRHKSNERIAMEELEVNDGFYVGDDEAYRRAHDTRYSLVHRKFTIVKVHGERRWLVRRVA